MKKNIILLLSICTTILSLDACSKKDNPSDGGSNTIQVLTAFSNPDSTLSPHYNSGTIEPIWDNATALVVTALPIGAGNSGASFQVGIKSIVDKSHIYFLVQYDDADQSMLRQPLHYHGGGWTEPTNWSFDTTVFDDAFSFVFEDPLNKGLRGAKTFATDGCAMLCHTTATSKWEPGMFAENSANYDLWYWHSAKGNAVGYADDDILLGDPSFGISHDDDNAEIYKNNVIEHAPGYTPYLVAAGNNLGYDKKYYVAENTGVTFETSPKNPSTGALWAADDLVPSAYLSTPNPGSDYFDVHAKGYWSGGKWTVKFERKLNTGIGNQDVQFASGNEYLFSFAVDNKTAPGKHFGAANSAFKLKLP
ncbi:MAG: ethylbenzene dehydrogenase-related protein [bacterium]